MGMIACYQMIEDSVISELKKKDAKALMINKNENQNFYYYAKHILKNKPTGVLTPDNSFEYWII